MPAIQPSPRSPGRPRAFAMDDMLARAQIVFRERGYHATSISDLSEAVGLSTGSIYKAFKDKRAVFVAAFQCYVDTRRASLHQRLERGANGYEKVRIALTFYAESASGVEGELGCLVVGSVTDLSTFDAEVADLIRHAVQRNAALLLELIAQGQADGSIPASVDADAMAHFMLCLLQGMRVVGKADAAPAKMQAVVAQALRLLA